MNINNTFQLIWSTHFAMFMKMLNTKIRVVIVGAFFLISIVGLAVSYMAPYVANDDEIVYLTGSLQAKDHNLPDAYMLQGIDFGPYLYPKIMSAEYESLGNFTFKSIYLVVLIFAIGLAAYAMFRLLGLQWIPSLLLSIVALIPRFASGQEIFGVLTFREAIGRSDALPLFFLGTGFLIRRMGKGKSLWPLFGIFGLMLFLHPVTVMLFAFISLISVAVTRVFQRVSLWKVLCEMVVSGSVFVMAGSYFFVEVLSRLSHGAASEGVNTFLYVQAITSRTAWDFPAGVIQWYPHMAIVSAFFIGALVIFYTIPATRALRAKYKFSQSKDILVWGITIATGSLLFGFALNGINLYLMEHIHAPYIFQQWSRITKFYYLGIFVAMTPMVYVLWQKYLESQWRFKTTAVALLFIAGILSSSFAFEVAQFVVGYKNFEKAYIPQGLSHVPDDITPVEYREVCDALIKLGASTTTLVISDDFAFRYYCKSHLYVTNEEGGAYQQLLRSDVVAWYAKLSAQRVALESANPYTMLSFAKSIKASFIIVPLTSGTSDIFSSKSLKDLEIVKTARYSILRVIQ